MDHETYLVTGGTDGKGRVWKVGTGERSLLNGHTKEINGIILLSDGRIATASGDKSIIVWIADHQIEDAEEPVDEYDDDDD
jgi:WD40 repeat protein